MFSCRKKGREEENGEILKYRNDSGKYGKLELRKHQQVILMERYFHEFFLLKNISHYINTRLFRVSWPKMKHASEIVRSAQFKKYTRKLCFNIFVLWKFISYNKYTGAAKGELRTLLEQFKTDKMHTNLLMMSKKQRKENNKQPKRN